MKQRLIIFAILAVVITYGGLQYNRQLDKEADRNRQAGLASSLDALQQPMTNLKTEDLKIGDGTEAVSGKRVTVNYRGTLEDGTEFDSSYSRNQPFSFNLGQGEVIQGWDLGVKGMKIGGKRKLTIPPELGYGDGGVPGVIPGGATLIFEVELLDVE